MALRRLHLSSFVAHLAALFIAGSGCVLAAIAEPALPEPAIEAHVRAVDAAIASHALFAMLVQDRADFRQEWERRVRQRLLRAPLAGETSQVAVRAGMGLAMEASKPYLMRASDAASNRFLASLTGLIALGETDPEVCLAYVESNDDVTINGSRRDAVESGLGDAVVSDLLDSLTQVVASGRNGEDRVLTRQELQPALQPVILAMAEKNGVQSLQGLAKVNDPRALPLERCQAMARMLVAFTVQPAAKRAMLARTLFSGALPDVE